jgi:chloramphenicol 3-O phosphotransferase
MSNNGDVGDVILLVGTSCAGKTTIAQAIQRISGKPYLSTGHDDFLPMFPLKYVGLDKSIQPKVHVWPEPGSEMTKQGYEVIVEKMSEPPVFHLYCGPTAWCSIQGMHAAFAALARVGNNVIIADVVSEVLLVDYCKALQGLSVYLIHVDCALEELERRERSHQNRTVGGARVQFGAVRTPGEFDLVVDAGKADADSCARQILSFIEANSPEKFAQLSRRYAGRQISEFPVRIW